MATAINLPLEFVPNNCLTPAADAAGRTGDWVSLENAVKAWIVCYIEQGNAATVTISIQQASAVAGTGAKAINAVARIWANEDATAGSTFTRATDDDAFTTSATLEQKIIVFEIDPAQCLDVAGGFDCITAVTGASNAANITSALTFVQPKYIGGGVSFMAD